MERLASKRNLWFTISLIVIVPGVVSLLLNGLNLGIDFTGGTLWEIQFNQPVSTEAVKDVLTRNGFGNSVVQNTKEGNAENVVLIRMRELREGSPEKRQIEADFQADSRLGSFVERQIETVGSSVGNAIRNRAIFAVLLASVGILLYIAYAFRNTQNPLLYGICALVAMLHDVLVVVGIFSILGEVAHVEIDALFVTALLTVIGFSVHDTIVVFDRIRENVARFPGESFERIVNFSVNQTLDRSLNTTLTVLFTLTALLLLGGVTIRNFVLVLLVGITSGTYSSIFNASCLLVVWENGDLGRFWRHITGRGAATPAAAPA